MTSRERVLTAINHAQPDVTPCDYSATPEIHQALLEHFGLAGLDEIPERLGTDIRYIAPPYIGPPPVAFEDGSSLDIWGIRRRRISNQYGEYAEPVNFPYAEWTTVEQAERFNWPDPDWYDYRRVPDICKRYPNLAIAAGATNVQDFINGPALGRGVEQTLVDIATEDPVYLYIVERRHQFYLRYIERILDAAQGRIDLVYCGDDFGSQRGPLISPAAFDRLFAARKRQLFDLAHAYGAKITHHCCGSSRALIPRFIDCGMDALQTIQSSAAGMDPYQLKRDFAGRIALHGAVNVQGWLQRAAPPEIEAETDRLMDEVGRGGGFIIGPCHNLQPDIPLENVLTLYRTIAARRGIRL